VSRAAIQRAPRGAARQQSSSSSTRTVEETQVAPALAAPMRTPEGGSDQLRLIGRLLDGAGASPSPPPGTQRGGPAGGARGAQPPVRTPKAGASVHTKKHLTNPRKNKGARRGVRKSRRRPPYDRPLYPAVLLSHGRYVRAVASAMEAEAAAMKRGKERTRVAKKAKALRMCSQRVVVRVCGGCGEARPGSGVVTSAANAQPCQSRGCPMCQRRASSRRGRRLAAALETVPMREKWADKLVTLSPQWNEAVEESYLQEGTSARFKVVNRAGRKTAAWIARQYKCAVWLTMENAHGHIHAHLLVRGPYIPQSLIKAEFNRWLEPVYVGNTQVMDGSGFAHIKLAKGTREVTKYATKSGSVMDEGWLAGDGRECTNPTIVARWAIATHGARLTEAYGLLRKAWQEQGDEDEEEAASLEEAAGVASVTEHEVGCPCGIHAWSWHTRDLYRWVRECHAKGLPALHGSRWKPPELGVELISRPRPPP
jgi:hypothetical protein